ncbi:MAG: hypothetical protein ACYTGF_13140 [Planctomycetota bacterium]
MKARLVAAEDAVGDRGGPVAVHHAATAVGHDVSRELAAHDRQVALDLVDTASGEGLVVLEHAVGHGDDAGAADLHAPADVAVVAREQAAVEPHRTVLHVDGTAAEPRPVGAERALGDDELGIQQVHAATGGAPPATDDEALDEARRGDQRLQDVSRVVVVVGEVRAVVAGEVAVEDRLVELDVAGVRIGGAEPRVAAPEGDFALQVKRHTDVTGAVGVGFTVVGQVPALGHADLADVGLGQRVLQEPVRRGPGRPVPPRGCVVIHVDRGAGRGRREEHGNEQRRVVSHLHIPFNGIYALWTPILRASAFFFSA